MFSLNSFNSQTAGQSHWVCSSQRRQRRTKTACINIMDSMAATSQLSDHTLLQLATVYKPMTQCDSQLRITRLSVQQQKGLHDCGLFAVAYMIEELEGNCVEKVIFDQSRMREHFESCLQNNTMSVFPKSSRRKEIPFSREEVHTEELYCICKMPDIFDSRMISCDECTRWYHLKCVRVDPGKKAWKCFRCDKH